MYLDISHLIDSDFQPEMCSGSIMELGDNAGRITWENSKRESAARPLLVGDEQIQGARDYFATFGAWTREEIDGWDAGEVNALALQFVAGDIREMEDCAEDYADYQKQSEAGRLRGCIHRDDDGKWYFYLGG